MRGGLAATFVAAALVLIGLIQPAWAAQPASPLAASAVHQIQALQAEKASRTPAQLKMDSQLVYAVKLQRKDAALAAVPRLQTGVEVSGAGLTLVDIRATSTTDLPAFLGGIGATVVNRFDHDLRAQVPLARIEEVAARPEVRWVMPAARAFVNKLTTSEGDSTHRAAAARAASGFTGAGVNVGVLSDSDDFFNTLQGSGDLPGTIPAGSAGPGFTEVTGQGARGVGNTGEGSGMMEIVYDLAPNAHLFFATAFSGQAGFAANIQALAAPPYNCNIIIDDVTYSNETPFHLGDSGGHSTTSAATIINAVNTVVAGGVMYFSSAANDNNFDQGNSGTWEGDFVDGGAAASPIPEAGELHNFGGQNWDVLTSAQNGHSLDINLWWSDPLGGSSNDYDLFLLDSTGASVLGASTIAQGGTQDPQEEIAINNTYAGGANPRIVVLQKSGAVGRFLHIGTNRGQLSIRTSGATRGHNAIGGMCTAATPVIGPFPNPFNSSNVTETFSSDGLRQVFFQTDGVTALTPGNFSHTGGQILNKPDMTAADGVLSTWVDAEVGSPGHRFFGTSAAAPHAGAIAALLKSVTPPLTNAQILNFMKTTAIDIMGGGFDRDSGVGIVMADKAMVAADPCTLTCPGDVTVPNDLDQCGATVNSYPAVTTGGACGTVSFVPPPGSFFPVGSTLVTATSDVSNSTCTFHVIVQDTQHPSITCPANVTIQFYDTSPTVTWPDAIATDNCPGVTVTYNPLNGSHFPIGTTPVTATATDAVGNQTTCTFSVTVTPPIPAVSPWMLLGLAALVLAAGVFVLLRLRQGS